MKATGPEAKPKFTPANSGSTLKNSSILGLSHPIKSKIHAKGYDRNFMEVDSMNQSSRNNSINSRKFPIKLSKERQRNNIVKNKNYRTEKSNDKFGISKKNNQHNSFHSKKSLSRILFADQLDCRFELTSKITQRTRKSPN